MRTGRWKHEAWREESKRVVEAIAREVGTVQQPFRAELPSGRISIYSAVPRHRRFKVPRADSHLRKVWRRTFILR